MRADRALKKCFRLILYNIFRHPGKTGERKKYPMTFFDFELELQLFADGAAGAGAGEGATGSTGEAQAAAETGEAVIQDAAEKRKADYAKFKNDFKAEFDAEVQGMIKKRFKSAKENEEAAREYRENTGRIFDALAVNYNLDPEDFDGILRAVETDNSFLEAEALKRGVPVEELKHTRTIERENARYRAEREAYVQEQAAEEKYRQWLFEEQDAKNFYPTLDLREEIKSPEFYRLLESGVDVKTAFEVVHKDDIIAAGMQYAVRKTAANVQLETEKNSRRPRENGLSSPAAVKTQTDVSKLSRKEINDYIERARQGEKITFRE